MNCLVIGRGPWGAAIARTLTELEQNVTVIGKGSGTAALREMDAVFIATPASTHAHLVPLMFEYCVPVFCEKPFTTSLGDALALSQRRTEADVFLVNHQQLFNQGLQYVRSRRPEAFSMEIKAYGHGPFRSDCSGLWDWGSHAVAEAMYLSGSTDFRLTGATTKDGLAIVGLEFPRTLVTLKISNTMNSRARDGTLITEHGGISYQSRHTMDDGNISYNAMHHGGGPPPLTASISAFLRAVQAGQNPPDDMRFGMELPVAVIRCLTDIDAKLAAQQSA